MSKITPQIKETIENLSNDGVSNEDIQKFLLEKNVINLSLTEVAKIAAKKPVKKVEAPKAPESKGEGEQAPKGEEPEISHDYTEDEKIQNFVEMIEEGQNEEQISEFIEHLPADKKTPAYRHYAIAKQQIASAQHEKQKEEHQSKLDNDVKTKESTLGPIFETLNKGIAQCDDAIKTHRENKLSFSRILHAKKTLTGLLKSLK